LAILTFAMLKLGLKIPLKPFFQFTSGLIYYLGFKFLGSSIHALQEAHIFSQHPIAQLPKIKLLGIYPSWEALLPQVMLLIIAIGILLNQFLNKSPNARTPV
jgi:high-affinity iron transporter